MTDLIDSFRMTKIQQRNEMKKGLFKILACQFYFGPYWILFFNIQNAGYRLSLFERV